MAGSVRRKARRSCWASRTSARSRGRSRKRLAEEGAQLAFTFQGERIEACVRELADSGRRPLVVECDVRSDEDVVRVSARRRRRSAAARLRSSTRSRSPPREDLEGRFIDTPRDRFWIALDIRAYSLVAVARAAEPRWRHGRRLDPDDDLSRRRAGGAALQRDGRREGGARRVDALPRLGSRRRGRCASTPSRPGRCARSRPARSPASRRWRRSSRSARRSAGTSTPDDVGGAAAYLLSDDARNVTGTTLYVDSGYHAMGM